jgi:hypothetical protein
VPKQISTDDRTIPGSIKKRGNKYLRKLFVRLAVVAKLSIHCPEIGCCCRGSEHGADGVHLRANSCIMLR